MIVPIHSSQCDFSHLPQTGFLREKQILGDKKAKPPVPALIPIAHSSWWEGIRIGRYPKPIKIGPNTTAWKVEDIRNLILRISAEGASHV